MHLFDLFCLELPGHNALAASWKSLCCVLFFSAQAIAIILTYVSNQQYAVVIDPCATLYVRFFRTDAGPISTGPR